MARIEKITLVETILLGALFGVLFGLFFEYENYLRGFQFWINIPGGYPPPFNTILLGFIPLGLIIGYAFFGAIIGIFIYYIGRRIAIG